MFSLNTVYSCKNKFSLIQMCHIPLKSTKLSPYDMDFSLRLCQSYIVMSAWLRMNKLSAEAWFCKVLSNLSSNQLQRKHFLPPSVFGAKYSISLYFSIITLGNTLNSINIEFSQLPEPDLVFLDRSLKSCVWIIFWYFTPFFSPFSSPSCTRNQFCSCDCVH